MSDEQYAGSIRSGVVRWRVLDDGVTVHDESGLFVPMSPQEARLAACAPDLARMLLAVMWEDRDDGSDCGWCGGPGGSSELGHVDCPVVDLLKKAGVL